MNEQKKMEYRKIGVGKESSLLGYGCMRFPKTEDGRIGFLCYLPSRTAAVFKEI